MASTQVVNDADQRKIVDEALRRVRDLSFNMKREMDADHLKPALDHAMEMLRELRSNILTPKNYYELQMHVIDQLRHLEEYFKSLQRSGRPIVDIYEMVQGCTHVVPRLYLLCCVGGVYIDSLEAPAKDVLKDLVEMLKGVQHPMRGLFLRSYLTQVRAWEGIGREQGKGGSQRKGKKRHGESRIANLSLFLFVHISRHSHSQTHHRYPRAGFRTWAPPTRARAATCRTPTTFCCKTLPRRTGYGCGYRPR